MTGSGLKVTVGVLAVGVVALAGSFVDGGAAQAKERYAGRVEMHELSVMHRTDKASAVLF